MRSKCRFCGYRFESDDEMICPECLTAREDDIRCGIFEDELHSHDLDPFSKGFEISGTDMYEENRNDFVAKERREEAHDPNFKSPERKISPQQQYVPPAYTPPEPTVGTAARQTQRRSYNFGQVNQNRTFNQAQNPFNLNLSNYNRQLQNNNADQQQKKNNQGCAVVIIIFIVMLFFIRIVTGISESVSCRDITGSSGVSATAVSQTAHFDE